MNSIWIVLVVISTLYGVFLDRSALLSEAMLSAGGDAVAMCLTLAGAYALWCGLLGVLEEAGAMRAAAKLMRPLLRLFPGVRGHAALEEAIAANLSANMLGLGNAATPAGIEAMKGMRGLAPDQTRASDAMCMFLVVNASSIQLLPTTVISLRAAAGAADPFDIVLPSLVATACSTLAAVVCMQLYMWGEGFFAKLSGGGAAPAGGGGAGIRRLSRGRGL